MTILIAGDLVPMQPNLESFKAANLDEILGQELAQIWNDFDYKIVNLEAPITDDLTNKLKKHGPNLSISSDYLNGISELKFDLFNICNNHILDYQKKGIQDTIEHIQSLSSDYIGVGENCEESRKARFFTDEGMTIGIYSCAENEFSTATETTMGANPYDPLVTFDDIEDLSKKCDYLIILYHGGVEEYRYPTPKLQKITRKMIEKGADSVICQHSHCLGTYEYYKDGFIMYGQGNFLFNKWDNEYWNSRTLISIDPSNKMIDFIPIIPTATGVRKASEEEAGQIMSDLNQRSQPVENPDFVKSEFEKLAATKSLGYFRGILKTNKWLRRIDKRLFKNRLMKSNLSEKYLLNLKNYVMCESHQELLIQSINKYLK